MKFENIIFLTLLYFETNHHLLNLVHYLPKLIEVYYDEVLNKYKKYIYLHIIII